VPTIARRMRLPMTSRMPSRHLLATRPVAPLGPARTPDQDEGEGGSERVRRSPRGWRWCREDATSARQARAEDLRADRDSSSLSVPPPSWRARSGWARTTAPRRRTAARRRPRRARRGTAPTSTAGPQRRQPARAGMRAPSRRRTRSGSAAGRRVHPDADRQAQHEIRQEHRAPRMPISVGVASSRRAAASGSAR